MRVWEAIDLRTFVGEHDIADYQALVERTTGGVEGVTSSVEKPVEGGTTKERRSFLRLHRRVDDR